MVVVVSVVVAMAVALGSATATADTSGDAAATPALGTPYEDMAFDGQNFFGATS